MSKLNGDAFALLTQVGLHALAWYEPTGTAGIYTSVGGNTPVLAVASATEVPLSLRESESLDGSLLLTWWTQDPLTTHIARSRDGGATWTTLNLATERLPY